VSAFSHEIGDYAVAFSELKILTLQGRYFGPAQTASDQNREQRIIAPASQALANCRGEQSLAFFCR